MDGLLECGNCGENLDLQRRRPKLLPCGHTLCCGCVRDNHNKWDDTGTGCGTGTVCCPVDRQTFFAGPDPSLLPDDLQLVCWLEAFSQGVLECVCCGCAFDWLLRRPAALDCGHAVCRVCVQEAADARARALLCALMPPPALPLSLALSRPLTRRPSRRDSVDESWDYSQDDGDTCVSSSVSSLPSDDDEGGGLENAVIGGGGADLLVDCPVKGCAEGVRARDHHHLLSCLDDSVVARRRAKKKPREALSSDDGLRAELLDKMALLEKHVNAIVGAGTLAVAACTSGTTSLSGERHVDEDELRAVLGALRHVMEHKDSPLSEQPAVFQRTAVRQNALPDLLQNEKSQAAPATGRSRDDVSGVETLKEVKIALDVWDLSLYASGEMRVKKEALLRSDSKVWKLTGVDCWSDPEWTLRLLRRAAPDLEQLQLCYPAREHLQVVRDAMPHLRRLELRGWRGQELLEKPFSFDETPARNRNTLEWLEVFMPAPTALSLLRAHRDSLRKVRFVVADEWGATTTPTSTSDLDEGIGSDGDEDDDGFCVVPYAEDVLRSHCWDGLLQVLRPRATPSSAGDHQDTDGNGGGALTSLTLLWPSTRPHDFWHCRRFSRILRSARPHLAVDCDVCRPHQRD